MHVGTLKGKNFPISKVPLRLTWKQFLAEGSCSRCVWLTVITHLANGQQVCALGDEKRNSFFSPPPPTPPPASLAYLCVRVLTRC